jgi:hypothetical protein
MSGGLGTIACDANYANYTAALGGYNTNYAKFNQPLQTVCATQNPTKYKVGYTLEKTGLSDALKAQQAKDLEGLKIRYNYVTANYTGMLATTKALIVATEPLRTYKDLLQRQLTANSNQISSMQQQISSGANQINSVNSKIPDLSNTGPFGSTNDRTGVGIAFLVFYSLFFLSLSAVLYLRFKESVQKTLLIIGILIMLGGAGAGAYFLSITNSYGLGMKPISI